MADIDQNAVQSTSGAELQLADSETITSTLLLRDMHERCRAKGKAESPLVIVPQFLDVLTTRVFKRHPGLLEEESDANAMVGEDSSDDDAAAPAGREHGLPVGARLREDEANAPVGQHVHLARADAGRHAQVDGVEGTAHVGY